ncbi:hypothetical protein ABIF96_006983 [Bradyrhizobium ottawaense]|uniref:hypothetical protein n=1 Tax=Bradyrhizobium ottawaense TaxID=931866 RepID=UPI003837A739
MQALGRDVIDEVTGDEDRVEASALPDPAIDHDHPAAAGAHGFAVERKRLPAEAGFCAALLHDVIGQRQDVGDAGDRRMHAAFQCQNCELHETPRG